MRSAWSTATGRPIYEAIGMSEISTYISFCPAAPDVAGRTGYPQPGRRVAVLPDDGVEPVPRGRPACSPCRAAIPG